MKCHGRRKHVAAALVGIAMALVLCSMPSYAVDDDLQSVLAQMNQKAANFKSAKAEFEWVT